jgi:MraZ protein
MFKGEFEYTLDEKGRVVLPPRFRQPIGERFTLTRGFDGCVAVYPSAEWALVEQKLRAEPLANRQFVRYLLGSATEAELDRQGRFLVPPTLREYASIHRDVVIVGVINKLEVWSKARWTEYLAQAMADEGALIERMKELNL